VTRRGREREERDPDALKIPHDSVNEQVLIAAAVVGGDKGKALLKAIPPDCFFSRGHPEIWMGLQELERRTLRYDPATLRSVTDGKADGEYVDKLVRARPDYPPNINYHVECVWWDRARIEAARGPVSQLLEALRDNSTDPSRLRALAESVSKAFANAGGAQRFIVDPAQVMREVREVHDKRQAGLAIWPFGMRGLDFYGRDDTKELKDGTHVSLLGKPRMLPGAMPGLVTVVTALSGGGKTTSVARMVLEWERAGRRVLLGAWERRAALTLDLLAALSLGVSRSDLVGGDYDGDDRAELEAESARIAERVRFLDLPFGRDKRARDKASNARNLDLVQQAINDVGADVFVADLFRRAMPETKPDDEEFALYGIQAIAHEQRCHVVLVHQQRGKDIEQREDPRPTREGLKGAGAWLEVADTVLAWHRPALFKSIDDDRIECHVLKQRDGLWPQAIEFDWEPEFGSIENGRTIHYQRQGEVNPIDDAVDALPGGKRPGRRRRH